MSRREALKKRRKSSGFTLIELVIAAFLSGIVLMGMFSILTNMVSADVNGMRSGTVTAWSLAGIGVMNADIAGAGFIRSPSPGGTADSLTVCTNWSPVTNQPVQAGLGNTVYDYCWDTTDGAPFKNSLLRRVTSNSGGAEACPPGPAACGQSDYSNGLYASDTLVATGVYRLGSNPIFLADSDTVNAVRVRFAIGNPNPSPTTPVPVSVPFDTKIVLEAAGGR